MDCPSCRQCRTKRYWRPSQWNGQNPKTEQYFQCKYCDKEIDLAWYEQDSDQPAAPPPPESSGRCPIMKHESFIELHSWLHTSGFRGDAFARFVNSWMEMPRANRKTLSCFGAVESTVGMPVHYHCEILRKSYFDPSNYVYSIAVDILYGSNGDTRPIWNAETKGDILESLLGFHWLCEVRREQDTVGHELRDLRTVCMMSQIINFVVDRLYRVIQCYANLNRTFLVEALRSIPKVSQEDWPESIPKVSQEDRPKPKLLGVASIRVENFFPFIGLDFDTAIVDPDTFYV